MTACKSCGAEIEFVPTKKGIAMPLDPGPVADGNLVIDAGVVRMRTAEDGELERRRSHFASCPQNAQWRRVR